MIGLVLGGVGLFLLGMAMLTDSLQVAAGDRLRHALRRYTQSRLSSVLTGAVATAMVQSSSATTLLTIGFVGAGLMSLTAALGVVIGANVGTTLTSWLVAGFGLKVNVSGVAMPLVGVGALIRLFTRGKPAALGSALAGFGLIFVGIDVLQSGMAEAAKHIDLARYAGTGPFALILLVAIGAVMTVVMQSSSAAVATTLAAVDGGTIGLVQAAALVIGQNVGTTVTAGIGSIGGSAAVKRTALAHLVFNLATALVALGLLPTLWPLAEERFAARDPAIAISAFHTAFNVLGMLMFLPFIGKLANWLERRVPDRGAKLTRRLATGRAASPAATLEACRITTHDIAGAALDIAAALLSNEASEDDLSRDLSAVSQAVDATRAKLHGVRTASTASDVHRVHVALLHALDHIARFDDALAERGHAATCRDNEVTAAISENVRQHFRDLAMWTRTRDGEALDTTALSRSLADHRRSVRPKILEQTAAGKLSPDDSERLLEAIRWIDRLAYHMARAHHHLAHSDRELSVAPESTEDLR